MLADYQQLVIDLVRDDAAKLAVAERDRAIAMAVARYGKDRARLKVEDLTPTDANTLPLPAAWEADISELRSLEFPVGRVPPELMDTDRHYLYQGPTTTVIKVRDAVTVAAGSVRAAFTVSHTLSVGADTIPTEDREPVACWAASVCCEQLAALYSGNTDSTIQAANVQNQSKAQEYAARARSLRKRYLDEIGVADKRNTAAGTVVQLEREDSLGQPRLTHGRRIA
jgi:hypothetical protein